MAEVTSNNVENTKFSISFLNLIPQTMREMIPGYEVLAKPVPGLNFLDHAWEKQKRIRQNPRLKTRPAVKQETPSQQKNVSPSATILSGELLRGKTTSFSIDSIDFAIDENTMIVGQPILGRYAKVTLKPYPNGSWRAVSISVNG